MNLQLYSSIIIIIVVIFYFNFVKLIRGFVRIKYMDSKLNLSHKGYLVFVNLYTTFIQNVQPCLKYNSISNFIWLNGSLVINIILKAKERNVRSPFCYRTFYKIISDNYAACTQSIYESVLSCLPFTTSVSNSRYTLGKFCRYWHN